MRRVMESPICFLPARGLTDSHDVGRFAAMTEDSTHNLMANGWVKGVDFSPQEA